ncbi:transcription initiation factor IIF, beta subunit-domain-containing protein [Echria macrotheca]|uniref:Transcription initiation factor IIF subunit beta n=1 Tax=Echria macrotheca TaxID=438768 RepID=A0AAJ0F8Q8_9PEZI|nr:transcription initiation factor IIF, beta subunit-domain-containing protein [Echria macrotheca]
MAEQVRIKPEPEAMSPGVEDELDESTDLEFYNKQNDAYNRMYLARLPQYLWNAWSELGDDEEIQLGTIRQWKAPDGQWKIQMRLEPDVRQHRNLPKEYNMDIVNADVKNTFIFTEQDLPSYAAKNKDRAAALAQGIPAHLLRQQQPKTDGQPADRSRRGAPYVRRAIPKKTAIAGTVKHEVVCTPVRNAETDYLLGMSALEKQAPKKEVQIEGRLPQGGQQQTEWTDFLKTNEGKPSKAKKMDNKTHRWAENLLLDEIARCFSEHKYWSIKAFRNKIPQPEAFIRECLEKIAVLHRSGTFANHWSLKPEYQNMMANKNLPEPANDAAAPKPSFDVDSDDEEDDVKMEDVL